MTAWIAPEPATPAADLDRVDPRICVPLLAVHAACLAAPLTGVSAPALAACAALFVLRAFGLTAGYHRLLAHHAFRTSRAGRFALAWLGASAAQLGPLWWVGHHRLHHRHADTERDVHPPGLRGLWWAHMGWLLCRRHARTPLEQVPDLARFPELRWLDRWHAVPPLICAALLYATGSLLERRAPQLGADGAQLVAWGFFVSTTLLYHVTFAVNSLGHSVGRQRFPGRDQSRNHALLALLTLGDGWHNNHHRHPRWARHGLAPAEPDATYAVLRGLAALGVVWDLRGPATSATRQAPRQASAKRSPTRA